VTEARIASLHVYPLKGARPIDVTKAVADVRGLVAGGAGDREWMVVDAHGKFVTQRDHPALALVGIALGGDALVLSVPGHGSAEIALGQSAGPPRDVVVWNSQVRGHDAGDAAAALLSAHLGIAVRVVRFDASHPRRCNPDYAGDSGAHTCFADGYPVLVIGSASLADLNGRLAREGVAALPMNRFRPNVVVDGLEAYAEDHLDTLAADGVELKLVKPCTRCQVTTTDQANARVGVEPLRTLGRYRMNERLGGVTFGMNAIVTRGAGRTLAAGMDLACEYRF
jgi:uncharacterized protein YcbX